MAIIFVCPNCNVRLSVNDKHAGQQKSCPKCHQLVTIPAAMEIIIQEPDANGAGGAKQPPKIKPLERVESKISPVLVGGIVAAVIAAFIIALLLRGSDWKSASIFLAFCAAVLAPPLIWAGYQLLRNQELDAYHGRELTTRLA